LINNRIQDLTKEKVDRVEGLKKAFKNLKESRKEVEKYLGTAR
jgi:hypothetical protein